ncbi:imidazole glycerol phosphate synthase, glutamine amidotransferase subunit [Hoeflea phototrophica DFL-43]|jgi:glutamine amidotransferase|uniref:Imidazole glycerol phosphate synthase subunit HisH n=1 Tax=Hoeflea phototrophica (strain DSM 17068 / NCIMB 14078 / DFL-43) TaxID=411684 RepID=A9CZW2_HOEPD|nr:imidazole glycerol phosphate synthase subunit HisH [Hoeflea phototrophica]EDQ34861.1 imidazole glycerol phosphate synthase, glutamine amidotransferase subunit [Hoeflea phototrophica DFL-43]
MSKSIVVVDYGIGNVFSVCNALKQAGCEPNLTRSASDILSADKVILPGVGAFGRAIAALRDLGLDETLRRFVETERPFLGICIGMQLLMDQSTEFGENTGLGFIPGIVDRIPGTATDGSTLRVPHISWGEVRPAEQVSEDGWNATPLANGGEHDSFYFVHSFHCTPSDPAHRLAVVDYGGNAITAAVRRDNLMGVQFHPERSGPAGLGFLERFINL